MGLIDTRSSISVSSGNTCAARESLIRAVAEEVADELLPNTTVTLSFAVESLTGKPNLDTVDSFKKVASAPESSLAVLDPVTSCCPSSHPLRCLLLFFFSASAACRRFRKSFMLPVCVGVDGGGSF